MPNENEAAETKDVEQSTAVTEESKHEEQEVAAPAPQEEKQTEEKPKQSAEENRKFAQERRQREQKEALESAKRQGRVDAIIEFYDGKNPYTGAPMIDAEDVAAFEDMKAIEKKGGDPLKDYAEYQKKRNAEKAAAEKESADRAKKASDDVAMFKEKHPDVDLKALLQDEDFNYFAAGHLGNESLLDVYDRYNAFRESISAGAQEKVKEVEAKKAAREAAAVGRLADGEAGGDSAYYTMDEIRKMSREEINANWDKVQKSIRKASKAI